MIALSPLEFAHETLRPYPTAQRARGLDIGSVTVVFQHERGAAPDVNVGDHCELGISPGSDFAPDREMNSCAAIADIPSWHHADLTA
jgi:hypothetical protein